MKGYHSIILKLLKNQYNTIKVKQIVTRNENFCCGVIKCLKLQLLWNTNV